MTAQTDQTVQARAADFVARLAADDAQEADWLALEAWLGEDPAHLTAYERAEALWAEVGALAPTLRAGLAPDAPDAVIDLAARRRAGATRRWIATGAIAAAVVVAVVIAVPMLSPKAQTYATAPGETRSIILSDGSKLVLNGASSLTVRMGAKERHVEMADAEAAFDVAHAADRPFVVEVGDRQVRVVGTEFNIARQADNTVVTVRRGIVEVRSQTGGEAVRLTPGRRLSANDGEPALVTAADADGAFAWREGRLVYQDRPLSEVAADLSRRFATPVAVDPNAKDVRFTGVLVLDNQALVIGRLEALTPVVADRTATGITLRSRN